MKRGASIIMVIFEVLVVIGIVTMTIAVARGMGESETVEKINIANDIRMMVDTLVSIPNDAKIEYPGNVSKYTILLEQGSVSVWKKGENDAVKVIRTFYVPEGYTAAGAAEQKLKICMQKSGKSISLRPC